MAISPEARKRLDDAMDSRRVELAMTWRDVAKAGDISYETLRAARRGAADIPALTRAAIERGLRWARGSVASVLAGEDPILLDAPARPEVTPEAVAEFQASTIAASPADFVKIFRGAESVYLQTGDREGADRWLKNALTAREEMIRAELRSVANRDAS